MVAPSKLRAFADSGSQGMGALNDPSVDPTMEGDDDTDDDEGPEEATPAEDPKTRGLGLIGQWGDLGQALREEAGELVDEAHDIGGDLLLAKVPDEATEEVEDNFGKLPDELQQCLAKYVSSCPPEDVEALATAIIDGHDGDTQDADVKLVAKYLTLLAAEAKEEVDPSSYADEEPDDEDEDEDGDGEGAEDGGESDGAGE